MYGVNGWSTNWSGTEAANIRLTDVVSDNGTTTYAWTNDAFSTQGTYTSIFSGSWSGQGTFVAKSSDGKLNYKYTGDISGWTGAFRLNWTASGQSNALTFSGAASQVNAAILTDAGTLNVTASADGGTTFANTLEISSLTATSDLTLQAKEIGVATVDTITRALNASERSVKIGKDVTLTVGGKTTAGSFTNAGTALLNGGASITGTLTNTGSLTLGGSATVGKIDGSATVTGALTLTGVGDVYHDKGILTFEAGASLRLGGGCAGTYRVGTLTGGILSEDGAITLAGMHTGHTAVYNAETGVIVITSVYGWANSVPSKSNETIAYVASDATEQSGALSAESNVFYTLTGAVTGLSATAYDIKINSDASSTGYGASGTWTAGSVWLNNGLLKATGGFNVDSLGALYVTDAQLRLSSNALVLNPGKLYLGGKSNISDAAYTNATLSVAESATVACDVEVVADTKITVYTGKTLTFERQVNAGEKNVAFVGYNGAGAKVKFLSGVEFGQIGVSAFPSDMDTSSSGFSGGNVGHGITLCFLGGKSTVASVSLNKPSSYDNGIEIGGGSSPASLTVTGAISGNNGNSTVKVFDKGSLEVATYSASDPLSVYSGGSLEVTTLSGAATLTNSGTATVALHTGSGNINNNGGELTVTTYTGSGAVTNGNAGTLTMGSYLGSGNFSNVGTANLGSYRGTGSMTNTGSLTVKEEFVTCSDFVNDGLLTIGAADRGAAVSLGGVLTYNGNTILYVSSFTFTGNLAHAIVDGEYSDPVGDSGNGFITSGSAHIIKKGNKTAKLTYETGKVLIDGVGYALANDEEGNIYLALNEATKHLLNSTYFVNTGNVVYGATDNSTGNPKVTELCLTGGTLALARENLASGVSLLVTGDSTVAIGAGRTLSEEVLTMSRGSLTLTGAGTYRMAATDFGASAALTEGVVLGSTEAAAFTGTVWLSSGTTLSGTDLSRLTNESNSTVTLNGVSGYLNSGTIGTKLVLMNDGAVPALAINYGTDNDERTFTGSISGTGTIARTNRMEGNNTEERGGIQNFAFTGNIAEWTGVFDNQVSLTTNLTFGGEATTVNATLKHTAKSGALNVTTADNTPVTFNGGMSVTSLTAGENSTITLNGNSKVSGAVDGSFEVGEKGSLTVGGAATLTDLTVSAGGSVTLNGTATATGDVTVKNGGYLALGMDGLTLSGSASLTLNDGAIVALQGWTATTTETTTEKVSGVYTTGYSGGKLYTKDAGFNGSINIDDAVFYVKDGASFSGKNVKVDENGTVSITTAAFYNVASNDETTIDVATRSTVDYINVLGTLTGVNKDNIGSLGFGASNAAGVQGSGTLKLDGELKDGYYLSSFTGTIAIGAGSTFETDGNVGRKIKLEGGTLRATADMTLKNVSAASGTANKIEVDAGKAVIITSSIGAENAAASITKTGEGTLTLGAINSSGNYIRGTMYGDLTVEGGEVVLVTPNDGGKEKGTVVGKITINAGGTVTANGIDPLGYSDSTWDMNDSPTCTKTLTMSGKENAYAILNIASGKHVTLSTEVYMNGYAQINGRLLNAWSSTHNTDEQQTAYVKARGLGNVINADFYLRHHALFEVEENGELSLNGSILKFTLGGAFDKPIFRKAGAGTLILDSPTATTLYNLRIEKGEVRISTDLSFAAASALEDFSMTKDSSFTVVDDGRFTYGGWTYEMKDGSSKVATVTASSTASGSLLSLSGITIADTKLTNTAANTSADTNSPTIFAKLDNVAFTQDNSGAVTIADAGAGTQHLSSLAVNAGSVTLNNARLDAAKVSSGATLNFTKGTAITLGSTIQNAGTVALTGTAESAVSFTVSDLSGFETYGTAGYQDSRYKTSEGGSDTVAKKEYNGFFLGDQYYLVKNADGMSGTEEATVSGMNVLYGEAGENNAPASHTVSKASDGSLYFSTSGVDTKYYINNSTQKDTNYTYSANAENSMYDGYEGDTSTSRAAFATSGIVMKAEGGRLILATNLREDKGNEVSDGIIMNKAGSITVNENVTLKQSSLSGTANATLKGKGIYDVGGTRLSDIAEGFTYTAWRGTVQVSGAAEEMKLSYMGNAGSTVQMTGVSGTLEDTVTDEKIYAMDIVLVNGVVLVNGKERALALEFTANNGSDITFSGEISGAATNTETGAGSTMKVSGATAQTVQNITFTGDMSNWTGAFESGQGTVNLTLTGDAREVNAEIHKDETSDILNISIDGSETRTFNKVVSGDKLTVTAGDGNTRIILKGGGSVVTSAVLTDNNAILEVRDDAFMVWNGAASFAANGSSGIDIADTSGVVQTTIRTYVPTVASAQTEEDAGVTPLNSVCGTITNAVFRYDETNKKVTISKIELQSSARIENTLIDLKAGTTLELSNMVLADTVKITDASAKMISTNNVVELGSNNAKVNTTEGRDLGGVTLQKTGSAVSAAGALTNVSGKVYTIDFTGIQNVDITSGTLTFDFNAYSGEVNGRTLTGFELFYELGKTYDYIAVNFVADSGTSPAATLQYETLEVKSSITNGQGATATSTGYYNANSTSGVVVYFDAMALPEPTTSTLALLALTALCARRRRTQATR